MKLLFPGRNALLLFILLTQVTALSFSGVAEVAATSASCPGDCDENGRVTIDEIVLSVSVALGLSASGTCRAADENGDGQVTVDEIVGAVRRAITTCSATPTSGRVNAALASAGNAFFVVDFGFLGAGSGAVGGGLSAGPFFLDCPDQGFVVVDEVVLQPTIEGEAAFSECLLCDRLPLPLVNTLPGALLEAEEIVLDGLARLGIEGGTTQVEAPLVRATFTDLRSGLRFEETYIDLLLTSHLGVPGGTTQALGVPAGTAQISTIEGTIENCLSSFAMRTLEPLVTPMGEECPTAGRLRIRFDDGAFFDVRYAAGNQLEIDLFGDGTIDGRLSTCRLPLPPECGRDETVAACEQPSTQCLVCSGPSSAACGMGRSCNACRFDCTGEQYRCSPLIVNAACQDGIFGIDSVF